MTTPAIFFDRDGTLNEELGYVGQPERLHVFPFAAEAVRLVNTSGWKAVLITNQAGVARGYFGEEDVRAVHDALQQHLQRHGARLDGIYYCPHHPQGRVAEYSKVCECRKPGVAMVQQAAADLGIALQRSWVLGDRLHDIEMGHRAGSRGALVLTGYGEEQQQQLYREQMIETRELSAGERQAGGKGGQQVGEACAGRRRPELIASDALAAVQQILELPEVQS